jgi:hypothetical protein
VVGRAKDGDGIGSATARGIPEVGQESVSDESTSIPGLDADVVAASESATGEVHVCPESADRVRKIADSSSHAIRMAGTERSTTAEKREEPIEDSWMTTGTLQCAPPSLERLKSRSLWSLQTT